MFYKSLLPFSIFVNCEGPFLAEEFFHNLCPCFDIVFVQLGIIPRTTNKLVEIVTVAVRYLVITVKDKESKKQPSLICLPLKLADGWMSIKKEKVSSYLIYNIASFDKMAGKTEPFSCR